MLDFFPAKHVRLNETIIGLGAVVLEQLKRPKTVDGLWNSIRELKQHKKSIPGKVTLEDIIVTADFLYALGAVSINEEGLLSRCV
jgi:hypothetical protein